MWTETDWVADKSEDATIRFGGKNEDRTKIWYLTIFNIWHIINDWYIQSAALALDQSILDVDQVENLIKFCPTKVEMELLKVPHQYIVFLLPWWSHFINLPSYFFCQNYTWWSCYINLPSYFFIQNYTGDKETLGKCEQVMAILLLLLEYLWSVCYVREKLKVCAWKITFGVGCTQIAHNFIS